MILRYDLENGSGSRGNFVSSNQISRYLAPDKIVDNRDAETTEFCGRA